MGKGKPQAKTPTKLVGEGRVGDFVHQGQEMGGPEFRHVSKKWLDKCITYEQVIERVQAGRAEIEDFTVPLHAFTPLIDDNNQFVMQHEGVNFKPTQFALGQIAAQAGVGQYVVEVLAGLRKDANDVERNRMEDRQALLTLLRTGFSLIPKDKKFLFRTQKDGTLRAWLSTKYYIMDNLDVLAMIRDFIPGGMFSHWRSDGDRSTLWGNILIPESVRQEKDSDYGGMFSIGNSEIGRRKFHVQPSLFRAICMNGCIWDQTKGSMFKQVHRGKVDMMALRLELRRHINAQIPLMGSVIDTLLSTKEIGWDGAAAKPVFAALGHRLQLSKQDNTSILQAWREQSDQEEQDEGLRRSAFSIINAVTRAGRDKSDPSSWVRYDELGGKLLDWKKPEWVNLFGHAKTMKGETVAASFAMDSN